MSNYSHETGPIPLTGEAILRAENYLVNDHLSAVDFGGSFWLHSYGIIITTGFPHVSCVSKIPNGLPRHGRRHTLRWSEKLLNVSPRTCRLSFKYPEGVIEVVSKKTGKQRLQIEPQDIRSVDISVSGWHRVGSSQFLAPCTPSGQTIEERQNQKEYYRKLEARLATASWGEKPQYCDDSHFIKVVDPEYIGRRVMCIRFLGGSDENIEGAKRDGVVIDPRTKQLIARSIEYPLSFGRWGVTSLKYLL